MDTPWFNILRVQGVSTGVAEHVSRLTYSQKENNTGILVLDPPLVERVK